MIYFNYDEVLINLIFDELFITDGTVMSYYIMFCIIIFYILLLTVGN